MHESAKRTWTFQEFRDTNSVIDTFPLYTLQSRIRLPSQVAREPANESSYSTRAYQLANFLLLGDSPQPQF
jgi:hypothetical protein